MMPIQKFSPILVNVPKGKEGARRKKGETVTGEAQTREEREQRREQRGHQLDDPVPQKVLGKIQKTRARSLNRRVKRQKKKEAAEKKKMIHQPKTSVVS